ncbi:MAG: hypothetical protein DHS20C03_08200 [Minwuia thermotolerans]|nr:MAG: hypothetical protein DHS20C03_08200 [Minwuia thermotolerans]
MKSVSNRTGQVPAQGVHPALCAGSLSPDLSSVGFVRLSHDIISPAGKDALVGRQMGGDAGNPPPGQRNDPG